MTAPELITTIESAGGRLVLVEDRIRYELPAEGERLLSELRRLKADVMELLRHRAVIPEMPSGVSIVEWKPKAPPVILTAYSVVVDVDNFIVASLRELEAAMNGKAWLAGHHSVRDILERLAQCGVKLEVDKC